MAFAWEPVGHKFSIAIMMIVVVRYDHGVCVGASGPQVLNSHSDDCCCPDTIMAFAWEPVGHKFSIAIMMIVVVQIRSWRLRGSQWATSSQ